MTWRNIGIQAQPTRDVSCPPTRCYSSWGGKFVYKWTFKTFNLQEQEYSSLFREHSDSSPPSLSAPVSLSQQGGVQFLYRWSDNTSAGINANTSCIRGLTEGILQGRDSQHFLRQFISCVGIKRKFGLGDHFEISAGASLDVDWCTFSIEPQISVYLYYRRRGTGTSIIRDDFCLEQGDRTHRVQISGSVEIKFGFTLAGWAHIFRSTGPRLLRFLTRVAPRLAHTIWTALCTSTGIIVVGGVVGTAVLVGLLAVFLDSARRSGQEWMEAERYADGFLDVLSIPQRNTHNLLSTASRLQRTSSYSVGFLDALVNVERLGFTISRGRLLDNIGMAGNDVWVINSRGAISGDQQRRIQRNIPFPVSSKNYLSARLAERVQHGHVQRPNAENNAMPFW